MASFKLSITLGNNDAMETPEDVAEALEGVARLLRYVQPSEAAERRIVDLNGNTVGEWSFQPLLHRQEITS